MKLVFLTLFLLFFAVFANTAEQLNFSHKPFLAGKASLTESGYVVSRNLGTVNFSPELHLPLQLVYRSNSAERGIFGEGWSCPQLESSVTQGKKDLIWTAPWGEKIQFLSKKEKSTLKIPVMEEAKKGDGYYAPYSDWEAIPQNDLLFILGKNERKGWKFTYKGEQLQKITAPSNRAVDFVYEKGNLVSVMQDGQVFVGITPGSPTLNVIYFCGQSGHSGQSYPSYFTDEVIA